ncbi:MAG TPA: rhomboid family intramembrane serine protease [Syntrophomonadaceae bacterium]|nr:rhomboid family intramembrane serine protease [Syntrophomonadaceae bacterium]
MIPLRDSARSRKFPIVNVFFIIINVLVFLKEITLTNHQLNYISYVYGVIPARVQTQLAAGAPLVAVAVPFITAMFLHGSWLHILGNMLYLWIFGDNVEDRMGHLPYLIFYLVVGVAGSIAHIMANPGSQIPIIGASGAIAGVLGAYFISYPRARILTLLPLPFFVTLIEVPAFFFLPFWFILQLLNGLSTNIAANPVAWWAHIGGFVAGMILVNFFPKSSYRAYR